MTILVTWSFDGAENLLDREKPPLNPKLRDLADRERRNLGPHPTPEQLADYHAEKLSAEEEERIQEHLALCPECAELFLDLVDFAGPEPARDVSGLTDEEVDAAWQDMRARLSGTAAAAAGKPPEAPPAAEVRTPRPVPEPPPEPRAEAPAAAKVATVAEAGTVVPLQRPERQGDGAYAPRRLYQSLAAMFLLTTLGAGFWALSLQRQLREPQVGAVEVSLRPEGESTRSGSTVPSAREPLSLRISSFDLPDSERYRVEILGSEGSTLWSREGVEAPPDDGPLRVDFRPGYFTPGEYRVHIVGLDGEGAGSTSEFLLSLRQ